MSVCSQKFARVSIFNGTSAH